MAINQGKVDADLFQAQAHLYKHVLNYLTSMCLKSAMQLNIPDIIHSHGRPITLPELLSALHIDPAKSCHLYRLMRLLVDSGFFSTTKCDGEEEVGYDLTPSSRLLLKKNIPSLSSYAQLLLQPVMVHSSESLGDWFRSNEPTPFHTAHGVGLWEYISQNQEFNRFFNESMIGDSSMMDLVIKDCKSVFEGFDTLVDVGGGNGSVARIISESLPNLQCIVLDLPHVVQNLQDSGNLKFIGGDMFQSMPPADSFLFKLVLHAYSDEDCVKVLKKCREAIASKGKEGKLIIIDIVINEENDEADLNDAKLLFDAFMMAMVTGREREEKEWEKLFLEAGFSHYKITPVFGLRYLHKPHTTTKGFEDYDKRAWVERIMQAENRDITTALSVIQSNITAATFMASVSLTLCALIGAWISNGSNKFFQSNLIYGDINPTTISIKYICLLICFLLAFSFFVQSIRHFVHATYLISTPDCYIPVSSVETAVIRGDHFWSLGLRAIYFALDLLLWFFGPIPMFVSSVAMVIILLTVDSNSRPMHNTRAQVSQLQKAKLEGYAGIKK